MRVLQEKEGMYEKVKEQKIAKMCKQIVTGECQSESRDVWRSLLVNPWEDQTKGLYDPPYPLFSLKALQNKLILDSRNSFVYIEFVEFRAKLVHSCSLV